MTDVGKRNALILLSNCSLFEPDNSLREYVMSLVKEDIENDSTCITLEEAIKKYGRSLWYDDEIPKNALGEIIDNCSPYRVAALKLTPVFRWIFEPKYAIRH